MTPPIHKQLATLDESRLQDPDFQALTKLFLTNLPMQVQSIVEGAAKNDWDQVQRQSHKLKGSGSEFGFPEISEIARKINQQSTQQTRLKTNHSTNRANASGVSSSIRDAIALLEKHCSCIIKTKI